VGPARAVDAVVDLPSGTALTGTVPGVHGDVVVRTTYSRLGAKHRLRAWVQLLALVGSRDGTADGSGGGSGGGSGTDPAWRAATVGRAQGRRPGASVARLRTPSAPWALQRLDDLVRLRERALREPLPMPVATAFAYARSRHAGDSEVQAMEEATRAWDGGFEKTDEHHVLCFGAGAPLAAVLGVPDRTEQAWWPQDGSRLGVLARRVWEPLLDHEEIELA
jgi:exodeoxyribonuclease V gamma subunit